jgi:hypothetical protein
MAAASIIRSETPSHFNDQKKQCYVFFNYYKINNIMRISKLLMAALMVVTTWGLGWAHTPDLGRRANSVKKVQLRDGFCAASESQIDQEINNVRARLLGGGDCWWDFSDGRYVVPKVDPASGQKEVSSIYAASVWLGGVDAAGNLKLACQDYRPGGRNDFWPGPLDPVTGKTDDITCRNWDRHFRVLGDEIRLHLSNIASGITDENSIPRGVKGWPARGNAFFTDVWNFPLPNTSQGLAGFFDKDGDGDYEPLDGDYPSIDIRGCDLTRYPDEMIFWIYNDEGSGSPHARTQGRTIQMEVQVQSFGYQTSDELNDMTFQRYKLINRATELIDSMFFAFWVDADLGCYLDDYIGCDTVNSLMYTYNQDGTDGQPGCNCPNGSQQIPTYCNEPPILGVDYFRGPRKPIVIIQPDGTEKDSLIEIGMSSFIYYNNPSVGNPDQRTVDPDQDIEFYRYLNGRWRDDTPLTVGGSGLNPGSVDVTKFVFPDSPNDPTGWSMCTANLPFGDRRTLQASGPFLLKPGAVNELIIGAPWVPDVEECPDIESLLRADKLAQGLFDNCFERLAGPDAPTVDWVELNQEVVAVLTNDVLVSNNFQERYEQVDFLAPDSIKFNTNPAVRETAKYKFEGYKIYQLINPNVSTKDFDTDASKARLVAQVDKRNGVAKIYDWEAVVNPLDTTDVVYVPVERVNGGNQGIKHTFSFDEDRFTTTNDRRLVNHRKYYYSVVAYAYNEYERFDPMIRPERGQQRPYLAGGRTQIYTVIPRPAIDQVLQSAYGDGVEIIRDEGIGAGGNFLDLTDASRNAAFEGDSTLIYKRGRGPIDVTIFNPYEVKDGEYEVRFVDANMTDNIVSDTSRWEFRQLPGGTVISSAATIAELNEQIITDFGFSITIAQTGDAGLVTPGKNPANNIRFPMGATNGAIGVELEYADPNKTWFFAQGDFPSGTVVNFQKTDRGERDELFDPGGPLGHMGDGFFYPYALCDWEVPLGPLASPDSRMITPAWTGKVGGNYLNTQMVGGDNFALAGNRYRNLANLPNVDIVFTSDKSKWSRCVVIETANEYYTTNNQNILRDPALVPEQFPTATGTRPRLSFDCRAALSVGKDDSNGDGLPDPDGAVEPAMVINPANGTMQANLLAGQPQRGMGWFPGYAINVETGQRLNIFFGENSCYSRDLNPAYTGRDMMYNPTNQYFTGGINTTEVTEGLLGGQHYIYVQDAPYDGCERLRAALTPEMLTSNGLTRKVSEFQRRPITWTSMSVVAPGYQFNSYRDGLIPNDMVAKIRVDNPYQTWWNDATGQKNGMPRYRFRVNGQQTRQVATEEVASMLDSIRAVPNPYYGFSDYETGPLSNIIKITNLPARCIVTIYSLDGKFIRQFKRAEVYEPYQQIVPDLEWDLKNNKGIPVASGVYLFHVNAYEQGERTIKWFGVARQFDPSGL